MIEVWQKYNFADKEAFRIAARLSGRESLTYIANDMEKRLLMSELNENGTKEGINTALISNSVVEQLARNSRKGDKLLNDLIIFLTVCPNGLGLTEIEIVLRMIPSELDMDGKNWQIAQYLTMFKNINQ